MSLMDLLTMSMSNLRRRKLRTFLTVLGVVIGTASIVVMISLGIGMQQAIYEEIEQYGGLTTIQVYGAQSEDGGMYFGEDEESEEYLDDASMEKLKAMEHVVSAEPVYSIPGVFLKGAYAGYSEIIATTPKALAAKNIRLSKGNLPSENSGQLELVFGNQVLKDFYEKGSEQSFWDTGELPDIDLFKGSLFLILDEEAYYAAQESSASMGLDAGTDGGDVGETFKPAQKHVVRACGMTEGGVDDYNVHSWSVYCDLSTMKKVLQKEFAGRAIPGQPQTKNGKPVKNFCYSYAELRVDEVDNVSAVANELRTIGYNVETNQEMMESTQRQMAIIQAVLGGIGAVSLFVAAIGIANTMMMSIYERTKEIGVMKVLGCSLSNIRQMFLMEAAFIGGIGGAVGNVLSLLMSVAINLIAGNAQLLEGQNISYIPLWLILASIGFAMLVGILAGYFPAKRAMKLSPLEAIRNG